MARRFRAANSRRRVRGHVVGEQLRQPLPDGRLAESAGPPFAGRPRGGLCVRLLLRRLNLGGGQTFVISRLDGSKLLETASPPNNRLERTGFAGPLSLNVM